MLPEDHGVVFPGGCYLRSGEFKVFDPNPGALVYERTVRSPNGEDVLYVFHREEDGVYQLLAYNLIRKELATPVVCNGWSLFDDGTLIVFRAQGEPTRVHPLQVWRTPFMTAERAASVPTDGSFLATVGNADLVRGISDAFSLCKLAEAEDPTRATFEDLIAGATRFIDSYYWASHGTAHGLSDGVRQLRETAERILDEFEKAAAIRTQASARLEAARRDVDALLAELSLSGLTTTESLLTALARLRAQRGALVTLKEVRGIATADIAVLEGVVAARFDEVGAACARHLASGDALGPLLGRLEALSERVGHVQKSADLTSLETELGHLHAGVTLLADVAAGLRVDDPTTRTALLEAVSEVLSQLNRARAIQDGKRKELETSEGRAEFAVQVRLYSQGVGSAVALAKSPERCDEELGRMLIQLEELDGRFGHLDEFAPKLAELRIEVNEAFGARRQTLKEERQRKSENLVLAAERILGGIAKRALTFGALEELEAYFASDALVRKLESTLEELAALGDTLRAEDLAGRLKSTRQTARRTLRDKSELGRGGEGTLSLGSHRFAVQTHAVELALLHGRRPPQEVVNFGYT